MDLAAARKNNLTYRGSNMKKQESFKFTIEAKVPSWFVKITKKLFNARYDLLLRLCLVYLATQVFLTLHVNNWPQPRSYDVWSTIHVLAPAATRFEPI